MSCGVGCRRGSDPVLLWLWRRPAATALIRLLAWEPPYATGAAQEMAKRPKKKRNETQSWDIQSLKTVTPGVPTVVQWDGQCLWSTQTQVQSPAWHSGLRIQDCPSKCGLDWIPGLGTPYAKGVGKKKKSRSSSHGSAGIREDADSIPSLIQWVEDPALP